MKAELKQKRVYSVAFVTIFLDLMGFGIIIPIQPYFAQSMGASAAVITLLGSSYSITQFLFASVWGRMSDRFGRRPVVLTSIAVNLVGFIAFAMADSLGMLFVARMVSGIGSANIGAAQAMISDVTSERERTKGMGLMGAAFGLGFLVGPALGGGLSEWGPHAPAVVSSVLIALNFVSAWVFLPETNRSIGQSLSGERSAGTPAIERARRPLFSLEAFWMAVQRPFVARVLFISLAVSLSFSTVEQVLALFMEKVWVQPLALEPVLHFKTSARYLALYLVIVGLTAIAVQGFLVGRLAKRFSVLPVLRAGLGILFVALLFIPVVGPHLAFAVFLLSALLTASGMGLFTPTVATYISSIAIPAEVGGLLGLSHAMGSLGRALGPAYAGLLFEWHTGAPFFLSAAILAGAFFVSLNLGAPKNRTEKDR